VASVRQAALSLAVRSIHRVPGAYEGGGCFRKVARSYGDSYPDMIRVRKSNQGIVGDQQWEGVD
jgi:hypothetical protein